MVSCEYSYSSDSSNSLLKWARVFQCFLVACILAPFCIVFGSIVLLCRLFVAFHFKLVHEDKYTLCSLSDSAFAHEKHANLITISTYAFIKGQTDLEKLRDRVFQRIEKYETEDGRRPLHKLTWKLCTKYGFYAWETQNDFFDVRDHVKYCPEIDKNAVYSEEQVQKISETFLDNRLNPKKPQWEVLYVPKVKLGQDKELHFGVIVRTHHGYMDGLSLIQVTDKLLYDQPGKMYIDPVNPPIPTPSVPQKIGLYLQAFFMGPYACFQTLCLRKDKVFQEHGENVGPKYFQCNRKEISLESVKEIRKKLNCSTMAIFASTVSGALRRAAERKQITCPEKVTFAITSAVLPYPNDDPQNRFVVKLQKTPMSIADPVERLKTISSMVKGIAPHEMIALRVVSQLVGTLPAKAIELIYGTVKCGFAITNLPGYTEKLVMFGGTLEKIYGAPPIQGGMGFGVGFFSFNGKVHVAWLVEKSKLIHTREDMDALVVAFDQEFHALECIVNELDKIKSD